MGTDLETFRRRIGCFAGGNPLRQSKLPKMATLCIPMWHMALAVKLCLFGLLVISGNIERNPGPPKLRSADSEAITKEDITALHEKLDTIIADTKAMNSNFALLQTRIDNVEEDINDIKEQMKEESEKLNEIEKLKSEIDCLKRKSSVSVDSDSQASPTTWLKTMLDEMKKSINEIRKEKDDQENRSRRNNLVFFGVSQNGDSETWAESEEQVKRIIHDNLGMEDIVEFERVDRIPNAPSVRGSKPVVAMFRNYKDKEKALRKAYKLKHTNISISEDYTKRIRDIRGKLSDLRRSLVKANKDVKAYLQYDKLVVKEAHCKRVFRVNEESGQISERTYNFRGESTE
ncbi:tropomyosin Tod p 1.0102-like [Ptychodera flava]|uniref:tropomyosin Tod p 1.0102-like n=1 Tax=Ptychodera flava TaxID=63121 RepID=UPI00396A855D